MRPSHAATTIAALTAGLTAAVALHRRAGHRRTSSATAPAEAPPVAALPALDGVILPFVRPAPATPAAAQPAQPARCGDTGGETKAGAPCAARAGTGGRCHHHPLAA